MQNLESIYDDEGDFCNAITALRAALEPVTDSHELSKEGDKLSPPLPTLAVHVGYRYQSPVGGWEYGDRIPTGFDNHKWAHQKIYILQEQS